MGRNLHDLQEKDAVQFSFFVSFPIQSNTNMRPRHFTTLLSLVLLLILMGCTAAPELVEERYPNSNQIRTRYQVNGQGIAHGKVEVFSREGILREVYQVESGRSEGLQIWYDAMGKLSRACMYHQGLQDGASISFYENGQVKALTAFEQDSASGPHWAFWENGNRNTFSWNNHDAKHGFFHTYYDNGILATETTYCQGKECGVRYVYDNEGQPSRYTVFAPNCEREPCWVYISRLDESRPIYNYAGLDDGEVASQLIHTQLERYPPSGNEFKQILEQRRH